MTCLCFRPMQRSRRSMVSADVAPCLLLYVPVYIGKLCLSIKRPGSVSIMVSALRCRAAL